MEGKEKSAEQTAEHSAAAATATATATADAAAAAAAAAATVERGDSRSAGGGATRAAGEIALPPSTLAKALPHMKRLMPRGGEGAVAKGRGMLELLQGGGLVFPDAPGNRAALKQGDVSQPPAPRRLI